MRSLGLVTSSFVLYATVAPGCGSSSNVTEARCSACAGATYTAEQCAQWGEEAGCKKSKLEEGLEGACDTECAFEDCNEPPTCGGGPFPGSSAAMDAGGGSVDPACDMADDDGFRPAKPVSESATTAAPSRSTARLVTPAIAAPGARATSNAAASI